MIKLMDKKLIFNGAIAYVVGAVIAMPAYIWLRKKANI